MVGAERWLAPGSPLFLYGRSSRGPSHIASNAAFDASLRGVTPSGACATSRTSGTRGQHGFELVEVVAMPANNLTVMFERTG